MKLIRCKKGKEFQLYKKFMKKLYENDVNYRDYVTPVIDELAKGKSSFCKGIVYEAFLIEDKSEIVGVCVFLIPKRVKNEMQIAFMEYKRDLEVASFLLKEAKIWAKTRGVSKIVVGLNGHVNYGLGLSVSNKKVPSFGGTYTKAYYTEDFEILGGRATELSTYRVEWDGVHLPFAPKWIEHAKTHFTYRVMTRRTFKKYMEWYTELNNECFADHPFYYPRTKKEDHELFSQLKYFMEKGSLIFVFHKERPIGFFLWYPDWSSLMKQGETLSVFTYLKTVLNGRKVKTFKLVEWGIAPEFQGKGIPIGLLMKCFEFAKNKGYERCITGWILDENRDSNVFSKKWGEVDEKFRVYEF